MDLFPLLEYFSKSLCRASSPNSWSGQLMTPAIRSLDIPVFRSTISTAPAHGLSEDRNARWPH
jgi:hypothetical protein